MDIALVRKQYESQNRCACGLCNHDHIQLADANPELILLQAQRLETSPFVYNIARPYEKALTDLILNALRAIIAAVPDTIQLGKPGVLVQLQNPQTIIDEFNSILEIEVTNPSRGIIQRWTLVGYNRGWIHQEAKLVGEGVVSEAEASGVGALEFVNQYSPPTRQSLDQLNALSFDLVKGMTDDVSKDLNRIIREYALGTWDRNQVVNDIKMAIIGTENISDAAKADARYYNRAKMIAHTEINRAYNKAGLDRLSQVSDTFDLVLNGNPCEQCIAIAGDNPHPISDMDARPPIHPWCYCTVAYPRRK